MKLSNETKEWVRNEVSHKIQKLSQERHDAIKILEGTARGGARAQSIVQQHIDFHRKAIAARVDTYIEAYKLEEKHLDEDDIQGIVAEILYPWENEKQSISQFGVPLGLGLSRIEEALISDTQKARNDLFQFKLRMEIEDKKRFRPYILRRIYEKAGGNTNKHIVFSEIASEENLNHRDVDDILNFLEGQDFIKIVAFGPEIIITHRGILEVERTMSNTIQTANTPLPNNKVFVVHGRNEAVKFDVARFLQRHGLEPIILHEQPNKGRTVIEKFVDYSDVSFAVVLLTPDDRGGLENQPYESQQLRARQNVILELGFFLGKLGRDKVCAIYQSGVEIPSDYQGILFLSYETDWKYQLQNELKEAGMPVTN